jgi:enamine deaminase RidA (YjgF/YER057c/UK114 family)
MSDAGARRGDVYAIGKKNPNLPFHPAVRAGDFIFVSGQVAKDTDGNMIAGTIEDETRGTIRAIAVFWRGGATLADVVQVTYLGTPATSAAGKVFGELFRCGAGAHHGQARALIDTKIEMDAIAYKPRSVSHSKEDGT